MIKERFLIILYLSCFGLILVFCVATPLPFIDKVYKSVHTKVISSFTNSLISARKKAEQAYSSGKWSQAIELYKDALLKNPSRQKRHRFFYESQKCRIGLSKSLLNNGNKKRALKAAKEAAVLEPEYWVAHQNLGFISLGGGKDILKVGLPALHRTLALNPTNIETLEFLTEYYTEKGERENVSTTIENYLHSFSTAILAADLNAKHYEWQVVINGDWQSIELPLDMAQSGYSRNYLLTLKAHQARNPLLLWNLPPELSETSEMETLWSRQPKKKRPEIGSLLLSEEHVFEKEIEFQVNAKQNFIRIEYIISKAWPDTLDRKYRQAKLGTLIKQ